MKKFIYTDFFDEIKNSFQQETKPGNMADKYDLFAEFLMSENVVSDNLHSRHSALLYVKTEFDCFTSPTLRKKMPI
jgi:hypothetical protein